MLRSCFASLLPRLAPASPRSCLASLLLRLAPASSPSRLASLHKPRTAQHSTARLAMKRRLKTGRKALWLAIFAVESTHEQTNFYRTAIAVGGDLSGIDRSHSGSTTDTRSLR